MSAPATLLEKALAEDLDRGGATLALGRKATARTAALINATAAHTMEVDDIYRDAIYHPGAASSSATKSPRASAWPWAGRTTATGTTPAPSAASAPRLRLPQSTGWMQSV